MSTLTGANDDDFWKYIHSVLETIPLPENREVVLRYVQERKANGIKPATCGVDVNALRGFCLYLGNKRIEDATKADVIGYVNHAKQVRVWRARKVDGSRTVTHKEISLGRSTLEKRKEILKPFFRWLRGMEVHDGYPPEVRSLKSKKGDGDMIPTDELVTPADLKAMIQAHAGAQDKARLAVLYESGFRAGEFCALNIGSLEFDKYGVVATLPKGVAGLKTGARRIRLFDSVPYLHAWFEAHPMKHDPKAQLWFTMSRRAPNARMAVNALWQFCNRASRIAGIKKDVHPHLFRHSAATERARMGWNEAQMRAFFGWSRNSDMPSRYVHLAGQDYEKIELERRGLLGDELPSGPALRKLTCRVCKLENAATATFCMGCRNPVSPEAEAAIEQQRQQELLEAAARVFADMKKEDLAAWVHRAVSQREKNEK